MLSNRLKALASARLPEHRTLASRSEAVKDIYDYYPEVERLLKAGDWRRCVLIFDHFVRNPLLAERGEKGAREPPRSFTTTKPSNPRRARSAIMC